MRSNDPLQKKLEEAVAGLGWQYKRKRDTSSSSLQVIPVSVAANAVLTVWQRKPHLAKFHSKEFFGKYYEIIFNDQLNAAQLVLAVLVFRSVDSERKRQTGADEAPRFLSYATHFLAMIQGRYLLVESGVGMVEKLDHRNFAPVKEYLDLHKSALYRKSLTRLKQALAILALDEENVSLQRLAAAFRRGDLLEVLNR